MFLSKVDIPMRLEFVYQYLLGSRLIAPTPSNLMQPPFPIWYNPDKRYEYHGRVLGHSFEQLQEFLESSLKDSEQEASCVSEKWCHWSYCHQNNLRMISDQNTFQNIDIARKADPIRVLNCQSFCYGILLFCILFGITSHSLTKHVFSLSLCCSEVRRCLAFYFWQNILIIFQYAIKANQSWKIKNVLIAEITRYLLKWKDKQQEVTEQILSPHTKLNHTAKF
jgi:hypothetical protein